jgi:hypothetical protein
MQVFTRIVRYLSAVMSNRRRLVSLLMGLLLLQMSILGTGLACETMIARSGSVVTEHGGAGGEHAHHAQPGSKDTGSERTGHTGQSSCPAAMSCSVAGIAVLSIVTFDADAAPSDAVIAVNVDTPASIAGAPEPPPPRI